MNRKAVVVGVALALASVIPISADAKKPSSGDPDLVTARQLFFGIENVNPKSGDVDRTR